MSKRNSLPNAALGRSIAKYRKNLGLSLRDFASAADVDYTLLLRLERGHDVRSTAVLKLAQHYGFPIPPVQAR